MNWKEIFLIIEKFRTFQLNHFQINTGKDLGISSIINRVKGKFSLRKLFPFEIFIL